MELIQLMPVRMAVIRNKVMSKTPIHKLFCAVIITSSFVISNPIRFDIRVLLKSRFKSTYNLSCSFVKADSRALLKTN